MSFPQNTESSIAIIPARGGSKRIPRKNVRNFRGKPIIAWSIEAALESGEFDEVMVSTDDPVIGALAQDYGASVPYLRSKPASSDYATTSDVLLEVLIAYSNDEREFSIACCLYPTAPFVTPQNLVAGKAKLLSSSFDVIMPIVPFTYPIWRSLQRAEDGSVRLHFPQHLHSRSQDLEQAFHDAGQWYWFRVPEFMKTGKLLGSRVGTVVLAPSEVQDIDTEDDWVIAEIKHKRLYE